MNNKKLICSIMSMVMCVSLTPTAAFANNMSVADISKNIEVINTNDVEYGDVITDGQAKYRITSLYDKNKGAKVVKNRWVEGSNCNTVALEEWVNGDTVKFIGEKFIIVDGVEYFVESVDPDAFNNEAGKKVKKIYFASNGAECYTSFEEGSFYGLSNLKDIYIKPLQSRQINYYNSILWLCCTLSSNNSFSTFDYLKNIFNNKNKVNIHIQQFPKLQFIKDYYSSKVTKKKSCYRLASSKFFKKYYKRSIKDSMKYMGIKNVGKISINKKNYKVGKRFIEFPNDKEAFSYYKKGYKSDFKHLLKDYQY